jgi:methyl-accepting chemotaxis protein
MLKNIIKKMTPEQKLSLAMLVVFLGLGIILNMAFSNQSKQYMISNALKITEKLRTDTFILRRNEKDFIMRHNMKYVEKFNDNIKILENDLSSLSTLLINNNLKEEELTKFNHSINTYKELFLSFVAKNKKLGLTKKSGIYKKLTQERKKLDNIALSNNTLYTKILTLNSTVDQFIINKDTKELDKFLSIYMDIYTTNNTPILKNYKDTFISYVKLQKEIGVSEDSGIHKQMREAIHQTKNIFENLAKTLNITFQNEIDNSKKTFIIMNIVVILFILFVALLIFRDVKKSLMIFKEELEQFFRYLNREHTDVKLLDESSNGTVGKIAKEVNKHILKTQNQLKEDDKALKEFINVFSSVGQGDLSKRITIKNSNPTFDDLKNISNNMIENLAKNIQNTLYVLEKYTKDDYTSKIDTTYLKNDFKLLASGVNHLQQSITKIFQENKTNVSILKEHSTILEDHAKTLTQTSSKQKESMHQSINSINEISLSINDGHKSIENMAIVTSKLLTSVDSGLKLVDETNNSMNLINTQAKQISKTLKIMDEIALQTSILSLNASVEASSAGEAGKGFAVVADEVRNLALKSTQAANQIKAIVQETETKIIDGQDVSQKLIEGFNELSDYIHTTTDHIDTLSHGIDKQNRSLKSVNSTIPILENSITKNSNIASQTDHIVSDIDNIIEKIIASTQKQLF